MNKRDTDISVEVGLIMNTADDVLRDIFQRTEYTDIIYPMVLIRRIENVLLTTKKEVEIELAESLKDLPDEAKTPIINDTIVQRIQFNNTSGETLKSLEGKDEKKLKQAFTDYLNAYTDNIKDIIDKSGIHSHIDKLNNEKILYSLIKKFSAIDLSPEKVSNIKMGYIFEDLIRQFSEQNNAEAGEHYTPREVIDLMIQLLDMDEKAIKDGEMITIYDPACGTGGMLTAAKEYIETKINKKANVLIYGQEVNDKTWAIAKADLLLKGEKAQIVKGDTLWQDGFPEEEFDYMVSNPPYGKKWGTIKAKVQKANNSRFDAGYPGTGDGQLLFTLHMVSKMKAVESGGSAIAIVHNGSPLFRGGAGSGESEIRRHLIENDWLETVVALPTNLFYNTGIATYIWIVRNNKKGKRVGKIQLINGVDYWEKMQRSLGDKRKRINDKQIAEIIQLHKQFKETEFSKIYDKDDFAFRKVFLELEEQDENGLPLYDTKLVNISAKDLRDNVLINFKSKEEKATLKKILDKKDTEETYYELALIPNSDFIKKYKTPDGTIKLHRYFVGKSLKLQTTIRIPKTSKDDEIIPWKEDRDIFLKREVEKPYKILREEKGYEIPFTREFYKYQPLPKLEEVVEKFAELEGDNQRILSQLGIDLYERV